MGGHGLGAVAEGRAVLPSSVDARKRLIEVARFAADLEIEFGKKRGLAATTPASSYHGDVIGALRQWRRENVG